MGRTTCAYLAPGSPDYPRNLMADAAHGAPGTLTAIGNMAILQRRTLAMVCSVSCPGSVILRTYDLAASLRGERVTVVGGFHAPMERECLTLLLRGTQPIVICPARSIEAMRVPREWRVPLEQGRMLVVAPLEAGRRVTAGSAERRNRFVAALADELLVAYAAPGGKTERLCSEVIAWGKTLFTLDCPENAHLIELGARPFLLHGSV